MVAQSRACALILMLLPVAVTAQNECLNNLFCAGHGQDCVDGGGTQDWSCVCRSPMTGSATRALASCVSDTDDDLQSRLAVWIPAACAFALLFCCTAVAVVVHRLRSEPEDSEPAAPDEAAAAEEETAYVEFPTPQPNRVRAQPQVAPSETPPAAPAPLPPPATPPAAPVPLPPPAPEPQRPVEPLREVGELSFARPFAPPLVFAPDGHQLPFTAAASRRAPPPPSPAPTYSTEATPAPVRQCQRCGREMMPWASRCPLCSWRAGDADEREADDVALRAALERRKQAAVAEEDFDTAQSLRDAIAAIGRQPAAPPPRPPRRTPAPPDPAPADFFEPAPDPSWAAASGPADGSPAVARTPDEGLPTLPLSQRRPYLHQHEPELVI
eukprot:TRINITY_DN4384_c2_g1_i1.p1 TRINITY_DN4384_c2_g1~~TRINITY_DN4384_c2_g1_i1.p1  ORF type:complete len:384 (+),score=125.19 TRINITY_DN4384_c2_g1_i1:96-1247(+)